MVPMILGKIFTRMTRIVGRHAQMIPTLTSMFDQLITSTWSHVGFAEEAKETSDWRRRQDTTVTLNDVSLGIETIVDRNLQGTHEEHDGYADLFAPRQLQSEDLVKWKDQHPDVEQDADDRVTPSKCVYVDALAVMFQVPVHPIVADRSALEDGDNDECEAV